MTEVTVKQMPAFRKAYKKLHKDQRGIVNSAIREVIADPKIGQQKKGDLTGVYVYKFKLERKQMLLAYEWLPHERTLLALGVHENFYRDLKRLQ